LPKFSQRSVLLTKFFVIISQRSVPGTNFCLNLAIDVSREGSLGRPKRLYAEFTCQEKGSPSNDISNVSKIQVFVIFIVTEDIYMIAANKCSFAVGNTGLQLKNRNDIIKNRVFINPRKYPLNRS